MYIKGMLQDIQPLQRAATCVCLFLEKRYILSCAVILLLLIPWGAHAAQTSVPECSLSISFTIPHSTAYGSLSLPVQANERYLFYIGHLKVDEITLNENRLFPKYARDYMEVSPLRGGILTIHYRGVFKGQGSEDVIDGRGIFLSGLWYPRLDRLCQYTLKATLPGDFVAVSEAERITSVPSQNSVTYTFEFPHPVDGISFIATNRYKMLQDSFDGVALYAYFFPEDQEIGRTYLDYTKKYLSLYRDILGNLPYKRFAIVENFLPTGYSMPTYTVLGQDVVRLPFIVETSLGHEIVHQWFGNYVYIDYKEGNWAEGLTTYLSDHLYEELKGKGWEYRKQILIDYKSYVTPNNEFPLKKFRARTDPASRAIGYGKTAMVFHMLKKMGGEEKFHTALGRLIDENHFKRASWADIQRVFEKEYGKELGWFFQQWINEKGLPVLHFSALGGGQERGNFDLDLAIVQEGKSYAFEAPVTFSPAMSAAPRMLRIDRAINHWTLALPDIPQRILFDEWYDVARGLSDEEFPPTIARLIGDEHLLVVLPPAEKERFMSVVNAFKGRALIKEAHELSAAEVKSSSLVVLGNENPLAQKLLRGAEGRPDGGFVVKVTKNPLNPKKVIGFIHGKSKQEVDAAFRKIFHYGKYSVLAFDNGRNVVKKNAASQRGMAVQLREQPHAISTSAIKPLSSIVDAVADKKIVYVGEVHTNMAHHLVQLGVIKGLYGKHARLAIGMEMFQRPFQPVLDEYIAGKISEKEFLKRSDYFSRWGFDYLLYKPIFDYARENHLPVVALNIPREIVSKVSASGIDSLSPEERKEIPSDIDLLDESYRNRLKTVFEKQHMPIKGRSFENFYQAQIVWDETMAMSIDRFLKENPGYQMVVVAGSGHLAYKTGIPKRAYRMNGYPYAVILNDADLDKDIADYLVFPEPVEAPSSPKLMVALNDQKGTITIVDFPKESISEKAGLQKGDVILAIDDVPVQSVDDLKIELLYKKPGDRVRIKVRRDDPSSKSKLMEFPITL